MNSNSRAALQQRLFPAGIPRLWCPTLSFFSAAGEFDAARMAEHLQRLVPAVKGILVPGSTGEGWEMSDEQITDLLEIVLPIAAQLHMHVLIGILKVEVDQVLSAINRLRSLFDHPAVVGITVCPPKGTHLAQADLRGGLARVLEVGIPTALYQLPQVTQNVMSPETFLSLADEYANFIIFKDTSGEDRVARALADARGVFMVRGSEKGGYSRWLRSSHGNYDGFLLSTANCFATQLQQVIEFCQSGQREEADRLSNEIRQSVETAFDVASKFTVGNAFTNANKILDHLHRYGTDFRDFPTPMLISGARIPLEMIEEVSMRLRP